MISTGLVKALKSECSDIIYITSDSIQLPKIIDSCEIVIINDLHHAFANSDGVHDLALEILVNVCRNKKLYGIINETLFHSEDEILRNPLNINREKFIKQSIPLFHGLISADFFDCQYLKSISVNVLYSPFAAPSINGPKNIQAATPKPLFLGSLYPFRKQFLESNKMLDKILVSNIAFDFADADRCRNLLENPLVKGDLASYFNCFDSYKINQFRNYILALGGSPIVVNLPSVFRGIACRLIECAQLGSYVISEFPRTQFEVELCSSLSNVIFYDAEVVGDFEDKLNSIPLTTTAIASNISNTVFDINVRAKLILDFISK